jgi:DNA-binding NarL/FixJ family response regulator
MEVRLYPMVSGVKDGNIYFLPVALAAVAVLSFLTEKKAVLRGFIASSILLFIMMPCLILIKLPVFVTVMGTLLAIMRFTMWAVSSALVIKHYRGNSGFYFFAIVIHSIQCLSTLGFQLSQVVPNTIEFSILLSSVSAVFFLLVAHRLLFHKSLAAQSAPVIMSAPSGGTVPDIWAMFRERDLTERETEIARLIVEKGLSNKNIAKTIFLAEGTVGTYATNIYRKFEVKSRAEFIALFVNKSLGFTPPPPL